MAVTSYLVALPRSGAPTTSEHDIVAVDSTPNNSYVIATSGNYAQAVAVAAALNATL